MRSLVTVRVLLVSGVVLSTSAGALVGGAAAAAPAQPRQQLTATPASTATWARVNSSRPAAVRATPELADVAPTSVRRVTLQPTRPRPAAQRPAPTRRPAGQRAATAKRPATAKRVTAKRPAAQRSVRTARSSRGASPLQRAVARIPGYGNHRPAVWVLTSRYGHYGATDLGRNTVYISPSVPASRLDAVVRHEWGHILSVRAYGGSVPATLAGLNRAFGGSGMTGAERAADCVATVLGANWTNYTSCSSAAWRRGAQQLLGGRRP